MTNLAQRVAAFAEEVQQTLEGVLPGDFHISSIQAKDAQRYILRVGDASAPHRARIPLLIDGEPLADLSITEHLSLDRTGTHLKTVKSDLRVFSRLERTPLLRLEYQFDMRSAPIAHWQVHAERGAFSHLLTRANHYRSMNARNPNALSSLHLPVGGERFRPCIEDVLQFLVADCGVDSKPGWRGVVERGRVAWRRRQLASSVRDAPTDAARVLRDLGWTVNEPSHKPVENRGPLTTW
ncbi:MAG TPA: hypothetical protein VK053_00905 [Jiangellaceae bacterium]|nr:hypothetical protein [Jiangellaceae bacterium]